MGKLIVISAPSGSGKTSIAHHLLEKVQELSFSISACSRDKREGEINGQDYYFLGVEEFKKKIEEEAFLEWEEVYSNQFYGTLNSEIEKIWSKGKHVICDIDVIGGIKIKKKYPKECMSIFIAPPSISDLEERLSSRGSDSPSSIKKRINKAKEEMSKKQFFDHVVLNDDFSIACKEVSDLVREFLS